MRENYRGLDVLRGIGIFSVLILHSAFYNFDGLYDLDFDNPPIVVTVIGLFLMFAGLFAMISGMAHTVQFFRKTEEKGYSVKQLVKYNMVSGILVLVVAYQYFIFTGPGLVDMANRTMDNSIFVEWIRNGAWSGFSLDRLLYVDSLVMIGVNILLMGGIFWLGKAVLKNNSPGFYLASGLGILAVSVVRIPLYRIYMEALADQRYGVVVILNWLVNKNNPILPYFAFALLGMWLAALMRECGHRHIAHRVVPVAALLLALGVFAYIRLPETMLERSIDPKWFAIMTAQMGLFLLMILASLRLFDKNGKPLGFVATFFRRFGIAGLTPFFVESLVSAGIYRALTLIWPGLSFGIYEALMYGFVLACLWGVFLAFWERIQYRYGLEYAYARILSRFGQSEKTAKMEEVA